MKWVKSGNTWHLTDGVQSPALTPREERIPRRSPPWTTMCARPAAGILFDEPIDDAERCAICNANGHPQ